MIKRFKDFYAVIIISLVLIAVGFVVLMYINILTSFVFLGIALAIFALFFAVFYKRNKDIRVLSDYLNHINNGEYDLDIQDNKEGEMSLLKNNLYKIVVTLRSQQELLQRDKNYLAESLADISHQLKTPITSITMMTDLLKSEPEKEKQREFIEVINGQLSRMNWLIVTLLKFSKIDAGVIEFKNEKTSIKDVLSDATKPFLINADVNQIELKTECQDNIYAEIDKNWYTEALSNIIKNCIEHTGSGGCVKISAIELALMIRIVIMDNGCGIDNEDLPHIFERFYQGKNRSESSVGIGLALSKAILSRQNSIISVKSEKDIGTEFEIKLYKTII